MDDIFLKDLDSIPKIFRDNYTEKPKKPKALDKSIVKKVHKIINFFGLENYSKLSRQQIVNLCRATRF